jgi:uncharacterized protein (TIGR02453 family)
MTEAFSGFPPEGFKFLKGLGRDNSKAFFDGHRTMYERSLLEPAKAFVAAIGPELQSRVSKGIHAEPRVNGSIFRINRDTRFSKDKTPYKTNLDFMFWEGEGRSRECAGLFLRLTPDMVGMGAGMHHFDKDVLAAYRDAVVNDRRGAALEKAIAETLRVRGLELGGAGRARVPRGYDPDHPRADLLKHDGIFVFQETAPPKVVHTAGFVDWCATRFERYIPVHRWVVDLVESARR